MNERDDMQTRAETAPKAKRSRDSLSIIITRSYAQDGIGLTPGEVLKLTDAAAQLVADIARGYTLFPELRVSNDT